MLQVKDGRDCPLLPSLTRLDLIDGAALSARRTLGLCDTLMKRVELGVPLEMLDLRTCRAASHAVRLLRNILVDVLDPEARYLVPWHPFVPGDNFLAEDYSNHEDSFAIDENYSEIVAF